MNTTSVRTLNDMMQIDHVIRVREGGVIDAGVTGVWAPEIHVGTDEDGQITDADERQMIEDAEAQGWTLLTGWTGQYSYNGPIMHASEYIGGGLETHIRETPGLYCAVVVETDDDRDDAAGWAVAYRETEV